MLSRATVGSMVGAMVAGMTATMDLTMDLAMDLAMDASTTAAMDLAELAAVGLSGKSILPRSYGLSTFASLSALNISIVVDLAVDLVADATDVIAGAAVALTMVDGKTLTLFR